MKVLGNIVLVVGILLSFWLVRQSLVSVHSELGQFVHEDLPIIEIMAQISAHQNARMVAFESGIRHGQDAYKSRGASNRFRASQAAFERSGRLVNNELNHAQSLISNRYDFLKKSPTFSDPEMLSHYERLLEQVRVISRLNGQYNKASSETFTLVDRRRYGVANAKVLTVQKLQRELTTASVSLVNDFETFAALWFKKSGQFKMSRLQLPIFVALSSIVLCWILMVVPKGDRRTRRRRGYSF